MCICNIAYKTGLTRLGEGMEGSLHALWGGIVTLSLLRLAVFWVFGI